jgi:HD-GYP domain-containing protein (c-di-GMP phosphodiesterase class II)
MPSSESPRGEEKRRHRRRIRILYPLIVGLVLMGLAPLLTAAWKLISISREALITDQQAYQLQAISAIVRQIDAHFEFLRGRMLQTEKGIEAVLDKSSTRGLRRYLEAAGDLDRLIGDEFLTSKLDLGGNARFLAGREFLNQYPGAEELMDLAAERLGDGNPFALVGPRWLDGSGGGFSALAMATSLERDGKRAGSLTALVDVEAIWEEAIGPRLSGYTLYALDAAGDPIAARDPTGLLDRVDHREFELVQKFLSVGSRSKETSDFRITVDGEEKAILGSFDQTALGWGIFAQVERQLAYSSVQEMVGSTWTWAIGAFGMAILIGLGFAASLSRPIQNLAGTSRALAGGDFSVRARLGGVREIHELAESFNTMAEEIQGYIQRLRNAARENSDLFLGIIKALAAAIDEKDPYTRGHSERVNQYSVAVAKQLELTKREIRDVHVASLLHDVGKIGIDDRILLKPSYLTDEEFEIMKKHPTKGAHMLSPIKNMKDVIPGLLHHHERYTGGGYPQGLKGKEIPLVARIITVADTFDAMTTNRPYQRAMTTERALSRLKDLAGDALDPDVVKAFHAAVQSGKIRNLQRPSEPAAAVSAAGQAG